MGLRSLKDADLETLHHVSLRPELDLPDRLRAISLSSEYQDLALLEADDELTALGPNPFHGKRFAALVKLITDHQFLNAAVLVDREDNDSRAAVAYQHAMHLRHVALDVVDQVGVVRLHAGEVQ